jgi:O-antigen ligase
VFLAVYFHYRKEKIHPLKRLIVAGSIAVFFLTTFWSKGNRGVLALLLLLVGGFSYRVIRSRFRKFYIIFAIAVFSIVVLSVSIIVPQYQKYLGTSDNPVIRGIAKLGLFYDMAYTGELTNLSGRYAAAVRVPKMLQDYPVLGIGFANYFYYSNIQPYIGKGKIWPGDAPNNLFLDVGAELGLVGLTALIVFLIYIAVRLYRENKYLFFILLPPLLGYIMFAVKWETFLFVVIGMYGLINKL